ncbi:MAG: poly(A) polymerase [Acidiferrobacteraceae bacterium]|nr:poly(A) polymerase [Acidiferrobacteraceae bacterium]
MSVGSSSATLHARRVPASDLGLSISDVSPAAVSIIRTLQGSGFQAEMVGGCVRDLLLGWSPKDFDVVTNATPDQIKKLFRRARVIGRRFQLVHVRIGREVIEVSTYRGSDTGRQEQRRGRAKEKMAANNVFGRRDEDVLRRDFTINALYYDPVKEVVTDYVDGLGHIQERRLEIIGDPRQRFSEDPVRMLRAVRFKAKLNLRLDAKMEKLLPRMAGTLIAVSPPRLFEEIIKVLHNGYGAVGFQALDHYGLLRFLFPSATRHFNEQDLNKKNGLIPCALRNTDQRVADRKPVISPFLFSVLLWRQVEQAWHMKSGGNRSIFENLHRSADRVLEELHPTVRIPRRISAVMIEIWELQIRLEQRRPRTIKRLLSHRRFRAAYDFLLLRAGSGEVSDALADWWTKIQEMPPADVQRMIQGLEQSKPRRKASTRRKRKRS